jgi:transcriptional antiterminator RfaH
MLKLTKSYHWFALYCMSRQEKVVHSDLTEDGYESYLPMQKVKRKWSDRIKWVEEPMFRSYVFVRVSSREYFKVLQHRAVMKYVGFGGKPTVVRDYQMEALRRALGENIDFEITSDRFKAGQAVDITAGPMCGCSGEIIRYAGKKSLLVRIGETGYSMVVQMPAAFLESGVRSSESGVGSRES